MTKPEEQLMDIGDIVAIYHDPLTETGREGDAKVVRLVAGVDWFQTHRGLQRLDVRFPGRDEGIVHRTKLVTR